MSNNDMASDFESIRARLEEIANAVGDDDLSLDDALDLYEEAVSLGMRVSETIEDNIFVDESTLEEEAADVEGGPSGSMASDTAPDAKSAQDAAGTQGLSE